MVHLPFTHWGPHLSTESGTELKSGLGDAAPCLDIFVAKWGLEVVEWGFEDAEPGIDVDEPCLELGLDVVVVPTFATGWISLEPVNKI